MLTRIDKSPLLQRYIPMGLALVILGFGILILLLFTYFLNLLPVGDVLIKIRFADVLVGATIYLKTAIDFALFMGLVMTSYPGWKNRIALETGTALGNLLGTLMILVIWVLFKEVKILLAIMIFIASLVLFRLAQDGLEHVNWKNEAKIKRNLFIIVDKFLGAILLVIEPLLNKILPHFSFKDKKRSWLGLLLFSFSVPFILGLDDFAGYVPLFNIVNVVGFASGVLLAHTLLNLALFISPIKTTSLVKNSYIAFVGTIVFIGLAAYGLVEVVKLLIS